MAHARIGPQLERAELVARAIEKWLDLCARCRCGAVAEAGAGAEAEAASAFAAVALRTRTYCQSGFGATDQLSGRESRLPLANFQFAVCSLCSCSVVSLAAAAAAAPQANDQLCQSKRRDERGAARRDAGPGTASLCWLCGSGQPHTLAVGAASFEFTAKHVAILCFARIWLRQAPLFH